MNRGEKIVYQRNEPTGDVNKFNIVCGGKDLYLMGELQKILLRVLIEILGGTSRRS